MMKNGNSISIAEQNRRGCVGCANYKVYPLQLVELCVLPGDQCTYGEDNCETDSKLVSDDERT